MLTLFELKELLGNAVINKKIVTPKWGALRDSGAGVVTDAVIDNDTVMQVYENGFVHYETKLHHTVFPFRDALSDYTYESVTKGNSSGRIIPLSVFYEMPWVFRVLIEAEDRVVHNMYTSPTIEGCKSINGILGQLLVIRDNTPDPLETIILNEMIDALKKSEKNMTDYQRYLVKAVYDEERSMKDLTEEVKTSRHAIEDVVLRGLINMRKVFREMGYEIEETLLKYK